MPMNGFTVGRDVSIDLSEISGSVVRFNLITQFRSRNRTPTRITIKGPDGQNRYLRIAGGLGRIVRREGAETSVNVDDYFAESDRYRCDGGDITAATITETIQEPGVGFRQ